MLAPPSSDGGTIGAIAAENQYARELERDLEREPVR
jgi:hypothetical protein